MHRVNHDKIDHDIREAETSFKQRLEEALELAIQKILTTADDATDGINQQATHIFKQQQSHQAHRSSWHNSACKPSPLLPNVDVVRINRRVCSITQPQTSNMLLQYIL